MKTQTSTWNSRGAIAAQHSIRLWIYFFACSALVILAGAIGAMVRRSGPASGTSLRLQSETVLPASPSFTSGTDYATVHDGRLFIAYSSADALIAMSTHADSMRSFASGLAGLHGVAFAEDPGLAFVSLGGSNRIAVLDTVTGSLRRTMRAGSNPDGIIYDAHAGLVYAGNGDSKSATIAGSTESDMPSEVPLGGSPEFPQADERTGLIYQPLEDTDEVVVVDPTSRRVLERFSTWPCEGPKGSAIDTQHQVLYVGCSNRLLEVMALADGRILAQLPIGRFVDVVAFDSGLERVYTANASGTLTVVEREASGEYAVIDTVRTRLGCHTMAIDLATHRVFVVCSGWRQARVIAFDPIASPRR